MNEITLRTIAKMVFNFKSKIEFKPLPIDEPRVRRSNISKAKTILGWEPKVSIEESLSMTIKYFKDNLRS